MSKKEIIIRLKKVLYYIRLLEEVNEDNTNGKSLRIIENDLLEILENLKTILP